ncbi:alkane 1-monooxygenase [Rhodobacterales bacterium LSUCC1028]|nr:alkane 1-monooxygenase [Rhodobacterales bacterium LSUCC1028]
MTISVRSSPAQAAYLRAPTEMGHWPCNGFWGSVILVLSLPCLLWCNGGGGASLIFTLALASFAGQITHPNTHELIHHPSRAARRLGHGLYASLGMGHHASAHLLIHHPYVATARDPNSPALGLGFWAYLPRAWWGSFHGALGCETARRGGVTWAHPYPWHIALAALFLIYAFAAGGGLALGAYLLVAALFHIQVMLSDYIQHYGLRRAIGTDGRPAPQSAQDSWNAPRPFSTKMLLAAPLHSDHHLNPNRSYVELSYAPDHPRLPYSLPVMAALATVPPLWRRVMDPRAARWAARK